MSSTSQLVTPVPTAPAKPSYGPTWIRRFNEFRASTPFIVFTVSLAVFSDLFIYGIIVPVVPFAFTARMGVPEEDLQKWISVSLGLFSAGLIIFSPIVGYFADKLPGRRLSLLLGLVVIIASTVMLCVAKNMATFVVGRFIQGASGAVVWTVGLALISDVATNENVAQMMGYPSLAMSLGMALGPLIGGIVYEREGYYPVFGVCFAILGQDVILRLLMKDPVKKPKYTRESESDTVDRTSHDTENTSNAAPTNTFAMIQLVRSPRVVVALMAAVVLGWIFSSAESVLTVHLKNEFHFNSLQAALMFLCIGAPELLGPLIGFTADKFGTRFIVSGGFLLITPMLILLRLPNDNTTHEIVLFAALLTLVGIGLTCVSVTLMGELSTAVVAIETKNPGKLGRSGGFGQVYGLFNVAFALGSLIGPFQAGFTMQSRGWGTTTISLGIISFCMIFPTAYYFGGSLTPYFKRLLRTRRDE